MREKSFDVEVNPEIIKWAIETSGYSISKLSKKLKVSEKTIESWIKGEKNPTLRQLENSKVTFSIYCHESICQYLFSKH